MDSEQNKAVRVEVRKKDGRDVNDVEHEKLCRLGCRE